MNKIILTNIGNRNISYKGEFIDRNSFREITNRLVDNFETEQPYLKPEILPSLFAYLQMDEVTKLVIFYSDSPEGDRNNQDTVHEAEIMKRLFKNSYPHIVVDLKPIKCNVVDNNALMQRYRNHLKKIKLEHPDSHFILCDAGGTPQQKAAMKIMAEYLFDEDEFDMYNIKQGAKEPVEKIQSIEYRKVIDGEQMEALVKTYNYSGALQIFNNTQHYASKQLYKALTIAESLLLHNVNDACSRCNERFFGNNILTYEALTSIGNKSWYKKPSHLETTPILLPQFFSLALLLDIAEAYRKTGNFGFYVLYSHIFLESFLTEIICSITGQDIEFRDKWQKVKSGIEQGEYFKGYEPPDKKNISEVFSPNIPIKITMVEHLQIDGLQPLLSSFRKLNSYLNYASDSVKIDSLRNKFAHEGKPITKQDHDKLLPETNFWREFLHLSTDTIFDKLNKELHLLHHA